jgi:TonB-linked SusC/RagA family outer membrane protein
MQKALFARAGTDVATAEESYSAVYQKTIFCSRKILLMTKLVILLCTVTIIQAYANGQNISLSFKNAPLEKVFTAIEQQSGYHFVYTREEMAGTKPVSIEIKNASLETALETCFKEQPVTYTIRETYVIVKQKEEEIKTVVTNEKIIGKIINEAGEPIAGATITIKGSKVATASDNEGMFQLSYTGNYSQFIISSIGYVTKEITITGKNYFSITLQTAVNSLDETIVMAYGKTTRRLNTGNISKVSGEEISRQPVSNPLAALEGRVPGLVITQSSGVPGSAFKVRIQGQQSVGAKGNVLSRLVSNDPLFVIDGVPFAAGVNSLNQIISAAGNPDDGFGLSPFNLINPSDIESIEVLKDADATAIYGSRGANGVILITTKRGRAGNTKFNFNAYSGAGKITRTTRMLNTSEYVQMRLEGISNDGGVINSSSFFTPGYAPDLLFWDTTKYTDWKKLFTGGTANSTDIQGSISGGNENTQFLIGSGVHHETTVFPGDLRDNRTSVMFRLDHHSTNKKISIVFSGNYSIDNDNLNESDLTSSINLPPILPSLTDANGKLKWEDNGVLYSDVGVINPLSSLNNKYKSVSRNLLGNLTLGYQLLQGLTIRSNFGYNTTSNDENVIQPMAYANPAFVTTGSSTFGSRLIKSWIIEPQIEFNKAIKEGKLNFLAGGTLQQIENAAQFVSGTGYTNDELLRSINAAGEITGSDAYSEYKYSAIFGRLNYNWRNKYVLNISGRRDGSSRFGPGNQFANFIAGGTAWIFTEEKLFQKLLSIISYGKLKISYGTTGNDQIGDYKYISAWTSSTTPYQQIPALNPSRLANPDFAWEINKKLQGGIDLGFFNDKIMLTALYYRNRTNNQLVSYPLAVQTGFANLSAKNISALVQNTGFEFTISTKNISGKDFSWTTSANLTTGANKLISYPGLSVSSYASSYVIEQSLNVIYKFDFLGVDPATGIYKFRDVNNDGVLNAKDFVVSGNTDPKYYGGISNSISYKRINLNFLFEFRKQKGSDFRRDISTPPGSFANQPMAVLQRWQHPGDVKDVQKYSGYFDSPAAQIMTRFIASNGAYSNASFWRLKNLYLSYQLPGLKKMQGVNCLVFITGQNLITFTKYKGSDPENQNLYKLPPLQTIAGGIKLTL